MAEEDNSGESGETTTVPKKKLPMLPILAGLQLLLTLGAGGWIVHSMLFVKKAPLAKDKLVERAVASIHEDLNSVEFMDFEAFTINLPDKKMMKATLNIEVSTPEAAALIREHMPRMRARVLSLLSRRSLDRKGGIQGDLLLKDALREALNDELMEASQGKAPGYIREIYFVEFIRT